MTKPHQNDDPARSAPSSGRGQHTATDRGSPQEDPAEGSRKIVDRELARQKRSPGAEKEESEQGLRGQVEEEKAAPERVVVIAASRDTRLGLMAAKSRPNMLLLFVAATAGLALYNNLLARRTLTGRPVGRFVHLRGTKLHFLEAGHGQPLLLLHGNGASAEDFTTSGIFGEAAARYRVLAFDRPGFGMSPRPAGRPWTPAAQADLIHAAAEKLDIERYVVIGHSWGAAVALEMARRHPRSVAGVVVVAGYHYPSPRLALAISALPAAPLIGTVLRHTILPSLVRLNWRWAMKKIFHPATIATAFAATTRGLASRPSQLRAISAESFLMLASALFPNPRYAEIAVPVGIIAGAGDQLFDARAEALRLQAEISHSLVDIVLDAGHMVHQSKPQAVLAMIDQVAALAGVADPVSGRTR